MSLTKKNNQTIPQYLPQQQSQLKLDNFLQTFKSKTAKQKIQIVMELKRKNIELYELYQGLEGLYEAYPDLRTVVREIQRDIEDRLSSCSTNIERQKSNFLKQKNTSVNSNNKNNQTYSQKIPAATQNFTKNKEPSNSTQQITNTSLTNSTQQTPYLQRQIQKIKESLQKQYSQKFDKKYQQLQYIYGELREYKKQNQRLEDKVRQLQQSRSISNIRRLKEQRISADINQSFNSTQNNRIKYEELRELKQKQQKLRILQQKTRMYIAQQLKNYKQINKIYVKSLSSKIMEIQSDRLVRLDELRKIEKEREMQKEIQKEKQKNKQINIKNQDIRKIERQAIIQDIKRQLSKITINFNLKNNVISNSMTNIKQQYKQITELLQNKIFQNISSYQQDLLENIKNLNNSLLANAFTNNNKKIIGNNNNKLQQKILEKTRQILTLYKTKQQQSTELTKKIQTLSLTQTQTVTQQQYIYNNPIICFMNSNILPIINPTLSQQQSKKINQIQNFIINSVNGLYKKNKKVRVLRYLYGYQKMRNTKVNLHVMVDDVPNLLMIVKLKNQNIIGAFSQSGIISQNNFSPSNRSNGFLFQTGKKKLFTTRQKYKNNPIMPYDQFYIMIGNHDVKIRMESVIVESCFGSEMSLFRPSSDYDYDDLLHCGKDVSTTELEDYQFYQLVIF